KASRVEHRRSRCRDLDVVDIAVVGTEVPVAVDVGHRRRVDGRRRGICPSCRQCGVEDVEDVVGAPDPDQVAARTATPVRGARDARGNAPRRRGQGHGVDRTVTVLAQAGTDPDDSKTPRETGHDLAHSRAYVEHRRVWRRNEGTAPDAKTVVLYEIQLAGAAG